MRILITGSRDWDDREIIEQALTLWAWTDLLNVTVVQGCARGADTIAAELADELGYEREDHPADWDKHGTRAGPIRNLEMVKAGADVCLAFIRNGSRGASHCADAAERAGIPTYRYLYRDDGGVCEPRRSGPDSPAPGEAGLPGGSDDYLPAAPPGEPPWREISLSPMMVSLDCVNFYAVPEGTSIEDFMAELRESLGAAPS